LGAGNSGYLPGLARALGYRVSGLDYAAIGVARARRNLNAAGVNGEVVEADLFSPPAGWASAFDLVLTMGVVEHFDDTAEAVRACARYAVPGGQVLTVVPNMNGLPGAATRWLSRELYEKHVALTPDQLADAHMRAGLSVTQACYLIGFDAWVANPGASPSRLRRWLYKPLLALTRVVWALEDRVRPLPPNAFTSPWVVVLAERTT
jgi:SAM-dependent methyltransferase